MAGDIYCLAPPATTAHPVLLGVPHDVDPHFSPSGEQLAFRSDAELGVDNIWVTPWTGCEDMSVRPSRGAVAAALMLQDEDEALLASGLRETTVRRERRLLREGRSAGESRPNVPVYIQTLSCYSVPRHERDLPVHHRPALASCRRPCGCHQVVLRHPQHCRSRGLGIHRSV